MITEFYIYFPTSISSRAVKSKVSAGYDSIAERRAVNLISSYMDFLQPENIFDDHFTECQLGQRGLVRAENNR